MHLELRFDSALWRVACFRQIPQCLLTLSPTLHHGLPLAMININTAAAEKSTRCTIYQGLSYQTCAAKLRKQTMGAGVGDTDGHDPSDPATSCSCRQPIDEARSIFISTASNSDVLLAACLSRNNYSAAACVSRIQAERGCVVACLYKLYSKRKCLFPLSFGRLTERHDS